MFCAGAYIAWDRLDSNFENKSVYFSLPTKTAESKTAKRNISAKPPKTTKQITAKKKPKVDQIDLSDVAQLDFIPQIRNKDTTSVRQVKPLMVKKNSKAAKAKLRTVIMPVSGQAAIIKRKVKANEYELSLHDQASQKPIETKIIKIAQLSNLALDPQKYNIKKIAQSKEDEDRISTELSAIEKSLPRQQKSKPYIAPKAENDELMFFDYSSDNTQEQLVASDQKVIAKKPVRLETKETPVAMEQEEIVVKKKLITSNEPSGVEFDTSAMQALEKSIQKLQQVDLTEVKSSFQVADSNPAKEVVRSFKADKKNLTGCLATKALSKQYSYDYSLTMLGIHRGRETNKEIHHFELRFQDDLDEIARDYGEGVIKLSGELQGELNTRRGTFYTRGYYPVALDLVIEDAEAKIQVPAFTIEKFEHLISQTNARDLGSHILIELDQRTEDVEIGADHQYQRKVYLNSEFSIVDRNNSDFNYILFLGVDTGNIIVNYKDTQSRILTRLIHLSAGEIYYDPNFYADFTLERISLYEENVFTNCLSLLDVGSDQVNPWAFDFKVIKENTNAISIRNSVYPLGARKYFEIKHLQEPIFFGTWEASEIALPTEPYIEQVLNTLDVQGGECIVQLNLNKTPKDIKHNGMSKSGGLYITESFLDKDGKFYQDPTDQTKRIFLKGEEQGIINLQIIYLDDSKQFFQTYCSPETYLVEQL